VIDEAQRQLLLDNPALFIVRYFPHRITKLEEFHLRLIHTASTDVRALILYPATHGKTTIVSTLLPIWRICKDPNVRIVIIGKNDTETEGIMAVIQSELTDNTELIRDFGPFKPDSQDDKPWALGRMSVQKRTRRAKEPTITVFGSGAKTVLGYRTDLTICDDVVTDKNSATPEQRRKLRDWFDLCVETGPEHQDSQLIVVGTRFDPADLYADLERMQFEGGNLWKLQLEDAIVDEEEHKTLWPERWPWKRLMQQKAKQGTLNFNKRYRNIAVDASRMVFKEEYVKGGTIGPVEFPGCLDRSYSVGGYETHWKRVGGFDPAVGLTRSAKFCAHLVLAAGSCVLHDRCFWVVDLERDQWTLPQQVDTIISKHEEYQLLISKIEANSFQAGLAQEVESKLKAQDKALRIEPHYTTRVNKPDPELGVQSMSPWFERGAVHIPWADAHSQRKMAVLVDELVQYPGRTTDTVMAMWFAYRALQESMPKFGSLNRLQKDAPMWNRRISRRVIRNPAYAQQGPV
jgi:hypothetical protein